MNLDLNCDVGEGGPDADLLPLVTSASIACGFHAGDAPTALAALRLAAQHHVRVGAHPGFPDRTHFGRRELDRAPEDIFADCVYQIGALAALAQTVNVRLTHVKPHGALYNLAMRDETIARPVVEAAAQFHLPLLGLPDSCVERLCRERVPFIAEGFADRRYRPDGTLTPRTEPDALIRAPAEAVEQALRLRRGGRIQTLCVHGDSPDALRFLQELRAALKREGVTVRSFA